MELSIYRLSKARTVQLASLSACLTVRLVRLSVCTAKASSTPQFMTEGGRFNRDSGYELPDGWIATYNKLRGGASFSSAHRQTHEAHGQACELASYAVRAFRQPDNL